MVNTLSAIDVHKLIVCKLNYGWVSIGKSLSQPILMGVRASVCLSVQPCTELLRKYPCDCQCFLFCFFFKVQRKETTWCLTYSSGFMLFYYFNTNKVHASFFVGMPVLVRRSSCAQLQSCTSGSRSFTRGGRLSEWLFCMKPVHSPVIR